MLVTNCSGQQLTYSIIENVEKFITSKLNGLRLPPKKKMSFHLRLGKCLHLINRCNPKPAL